MADSQCCKHSYCTTYTTDPSGLCPGHRTMTNTERFTLALTEAYRDLFATDVDYTEVSRQLTPEQLAATVTRALAHGTASKDGAGIKRACKVVGIKPTYQAIKAYLVADATKGTT